MNIIWVATTGSDTTGTGSRDLPYATIEKAVHEMVSGDQVRILDGTYIPTDTIVVSGIEGSIFAENPLEVTIQPATTEVSGACIAILQSTRFMICGVNILQAVDSSKNLIGLLVRDVDNFIAYTCKVTGFEVLSGDAYGIYADGSGRIEHCTVGGIVGLGSGNTAYGIRTFGIHVIDCSTVEISGANGCQAAGLVGTVRLPPWTTP
jgi:hypothetical protein